MVSCRTPQATAIKAVTLSATSHRRVPLRIPHLRSLGLDRVADLRYRQPHERSSAYGRMAESSAGKDSVTGHWEMMGIVLDRPFATFPNGFPQDIIESFEQRIGRRTLGNVVASGTEIIERLGGEHVRTGRPIVYTSADSVFQVAAHEDVIPVKELYRICEIAFDLVAPRRVGRVIARPFVGSAGAFQRTAKPARLCVDATQRHAAGPPDEARDPRHVDWQGQRPVRREGHRPSAQISER